MLDKIVSWCVFMGMPVVAWYHALTENAFLNTAAADATGLEFVGDQLLAPVQFLLNGKIALNTDGSYQLRQKFNYDSFLAEKSALSFLSLPLSLPLGAACKGLSYLTTETQQRHARIVLAQNSTSLLPNLELYRSLNLPIDADIVASDAPEHTRRPGDENNLSEDKQLLSAVVQLFKENNIIHWVDCGTCLGAYRYGGVIPWDGDVDLAILAPDSDNALHVLKKLDQDKYQVQDWSNRSHPKTYLRVYNKKKHNHLDIYHFNIDPKTKTLSSILSNEDSAFMVESWKIRERRFKVATSYDLIFPLKRANFDGLEVFVPGQTKKYLQMRYGENIGPVRIYNQATGQYEKDLSHPYWQLPHTY